jgi:hypothetical protein
MTRAVATRGLNAPFELDLTPLTTELTSAVSVNGRVHYSSVSYSGCINAFPDKVFCHLVPLYDKDYQHCSNFSSLPPLPDGAGVRQPPCMGSDCYAFFYRFELLSHLLQDFSALSHLWYKRHWMDLQSVPGLNLLGFDDSVVGSPHCRDDVIGELQKPSRLSRSGARLP